MVQINYLPSAIAVSDSLFKLCCGWSGWSHLHSCIAKGPNHMVVVYAAFQTQLSRKFSFRTTGALVSCYKLQQKHVPDHYLLQYDLILNSALFFTFLCCSFVWARRSCNVATHTAAKLALSRQQHPTPLCFSKENLPEVILSACVVDSSNVVSSIQYLC